MRLPWGAVFPHNGEKMNARAKIVTGCAMIVVSSLLLLSILNVSRQRKLKHDASPEVANQVQLSERVQATPATNLVAEKRMGALNYRRVWENRPKSFLILWSRLPLFWC